MAIRPYLLADANGSPIPFDIINPRSSLVMHPSITPMTAPLQLSMQEGILQLQTLSDYCLVGFGETVATLASGPDIEMADTILLTPNVVYNVAVFTPNLSAVALNQSTTLLVNLCDTWNAIGVTKQYRSI